MVFDKVIKKIAIQNEYKAFVEEYIAGLLSEFGEKIHSIYMCGSIPKGTAKPFMSDADFTILCESPEEIDYDKVSLLKDKVLEAYPIVTKIDTVICSLEEVRSKPNEWGFWIKIICACVFGTDVGEEVPQIHISPQFILDLNSDTEEAVERVRSALSSADNDTLKARYTRGYAKRLIRALYSLVLQDTGVWEDELSKMKRAILDYSDIDSTRVNYLYERYLDGIGNIDEFLANADEVYRYIESSLSVLAVTRESID